MNIAVIGLGIIGGSFCKAIKKYTDNFVIGINRTQQQQKRHLRRAQSTKSVLPKASVNVIL